jgi:hypothetical protein
VGNLVELVRPILFALLGNCHTKRLVCDMLDKYASTTDNDIDDIVAKAVRDALMKGC